MSESVPNDGFQISNTCIVVFIGRCLIGPMLRINH